MREENSETNPYIIVVKFDKDDMEPKARAMQSGQRLTESVKELGPSQYIASSYDGSMSAFLVSCPLVPEQIYARLQAPSSGAGSALRTRDCVSIFPIGKGITPHFSKITDWLNIHATPIGWRR